MFKRDKVRRLHLVIVDLWRPWKINQAQVKSLTDQLRRLSPCPEVDNTTPLAPAHGKTPLHCRRFVYGYSLDGSDFPCYFLWPVRTQEDSFWLLESQTQRYVDLEQAGFLRPLGIRHFYDAFSLRAEVSIRTAAIAAFQFQPEEVSSGSDLIISSAAAIARGWAEHQEQPVDQLAPEADRRNVPDDVISVSDSEVDSASSHGDESSYASYSYASYSNGSSDSEPPVSEVSDQYSMLEHAYHAAKDLLQVTKDGSLVGGEVSLNVLESFPAHWPLAKLTLPLKFGAQRLDRLVAGYLMELMATHSDVYQCRKKISSFAKVLTVRVAMYLAKLIASLLRPVLYHPLMELTDEDTLALLSSEFWVRPVYEGQLLLRSLGMKGLLRGDVCGCQLSCQLQGLSSVWVKDQGRLPRFDVLSDLRSRLVSLRKSLGIHHPVQNLSPELQTICAGDVIRQGRLRWSAGELQPALQCPPHSWKTDPGPPVPSACHRHRQAQLQVPGAHHAPKWCRCQWTYNHTYNHTFTGLKGTLWPSNTDRLVAPIAIVLLPPFGCVPNLQAGIAVIGDNGLQHGDLCRRPKPRESSQRYSLADSWKRWSGEAPYQSPVASPIQPFCSSTRSNGQTWT